MSFKDIKFPIVFIFFVMAYSSTSSAIEYYLFFDNQCNISNGLIVNADQNHTTLLTRNGELTKFENKNIKGILVYNFISSPIKKYRANALNSNYLKQVILIDKNKEKNFSGFPVQFIEDLVVFVDTQGETHVQSYDGIYKIRPSRKNIKPSKSKNKSVSLQSSGYIQSCESKTNGLSSEGTKPNRILADQIKINNFLDNLIRGYDDLNSFQEKTYVYARPVIFNQKTRLNLNFGSKAIEQSSHLVDTDFFPSLEWSSGSPYRVQSHINIGSDYVEYSENIDPMLAIRSELKAHFFHATFIGNLDAMEAGKRHFVKKHGLDFYDPVNPGNSSRLSEELFDTTFNYMILTGFDYSKFSLSFGLYYPLYLFLSKDKVSEVLSTDNGFLARFMYTTNKLRFHVTAAYKDEETGDPSSENILVYADNAQVNSNSIKSLKINSLSLRGGVDYDFNDRTRAGFNLLYLDGKYSESSSILGGSKIDFSKLGALAYAGKDFGDYIGLMLRVKYHSSDLRGTLHSSSIKNDDSEFGFDGTFSIIF